MADEHPQPAHLIDDAIKRAEQQLDEKLQALRMSALAEPDAHAHAGGEPADLRPVGDVPAMPRDEIDAHWSNSPLRDAVEPGTPGDLQPRASTPPRAAWDDAVMRPAQQRPAAPAPSGGFVPRAGQHHADEPWSAPAAPAPSAPPASAGNFDEEYWAQTRTALRQLQRSSDELRSELPHEVSRRVHEEVAGDLANRVSQQVGGAVTDQVERVVREEFVSPSAGIRQLQQQLPLYAHRVEQIVGDELEATAATVRQLQEELPHQFDRVTRTLETAIHRDVAEVEQSVAENVTRMTTHLAESVGDVERTLDTSFDRVERAMRLEFDRIDTSMRGQLERVGTTLHQELEQPTAVLQQLQQELPAQFQRVERVVRDEVQHGTAGLRAIADLDLGGVLGDVVEASRLTLDKLGTVSTQLDDGRVQQAEDIELLVDSMTAGWEGVYGAVTRMFERVTSIDERVEQLEARLAALGELGQLEGAVEGALTTVRTQLDTHLDAIRRDLQELQPSPVVVTVSHPEAKVSGIEPAKRADDADAQQESGTPSS